MAVVRLREFEATDDRGTPNYDAVSARVGVDSDPPEGLILHSVGFGEDGTFRIYDVWESEEQADRFENERLMPAMRAVMGDLDSASRPVKEETYHIHHLVTAR
jgi:hypothetical protein